MIGYLRVSPRERHASRPTRTDQHRTLEVACAQRGWRLVGVEEDLRSGRSLRRPGLHAALEACRSGRADTVAVMRLDRLTSSLQDLAWLMGQARRDSFALVSLDLDLDLATDGGALVADVLTVAGSWQSHTVGHRTDHARAQRPLGEGARGRPPSTPPVLAERIQMMRARGSTLQAICDTLNAEGVPTPRGGTQWRPTSLRSILKAKHILGT